VSFEDIVVRIDSDGERSGFGAIDLKIDEDGDLTITDLDGPFVIASYPQARAIHQQLGQIIIRFDRDFQVKQDKLRGVG
jgi:hypothetical protein